MRNLFLAMMATAMTLLPLRADAQGKGGAADAIRAVISDQIAAFQADDLEAAFDFASPVIRRRFGTPGRFGAMVRQGYPMVWRPAKVSFLDLERRDGGPWQPVLLRGPAGALFIVDYQMVRVSGAWKINAVHVRKASGASA